MEKIIGYFNENIINKLNLTITSGTPIYVGDQNIEHMKSRHPYEYDKYFNQIEDILSEPDYIGINKKDKSIMFVKEYELSDEHIRVGVRVTKNQKCYARTLHHLTNAESYIEKGTLIPY